MKKFILVLMSLMMMSCATMMPITSNEVTERVVGECNLEGLPSDLLCSMQEIEIHHAGKDIYIHVYKFRSTNKSAHFIQAVKPSFAVNYKITYDNAVANVYGEWSAYGVRFESNRLEDLPVNPELRIR